MFSFDAFKKIVAAALLTGLIAGLLLTAVQQIQVIPTLLQAEVYEEQAALAAHAATGHESQAWQPENGWQRTFSTAIANISLGVGFALLMGAAICFSKRSNNWRSGLIWGVAGYLVFFVAPSLGLPPEVPGTDAAKLEERQTWWLMTVFDTALGLWLLAFAKTNTNKVFGLMLLMTPHVFITAPQPLVQHSAAPDSLSHSFITATFLANAVFWLAMGALMGFFYQTEENQSDEKSLS
jgi:cobalt transporter subunit CbtA